MQRFLFLLLTSVTFSAFTWVKPPMPKPGMPGTGEEKVYVVGKSKERFQELFKKGRKSGYFYYEELVKKLLPEFKNLPYGAGNVSCPSDKTLINFQSFDCVTLVESFWALNYTLYQYMTGKVSKRDKPFKIFSRNLNQIRYFGGENCGIEYRIHYFTQQMEELDRSGLVFNVGLANGVKFNKKINYISSNPEAYGDFAATNRQKFLERIHNRTPKYYYPRRHRSLYYPLAKDGDIVSFATNEPGLDVSHCGIISIVDGEVTVTHASSRTKKVVYAQSLDEYVRGRGKYCTGFFIYRPIFE